LAGVSAPGRAPSYRNRPPDPAAEVAVMTWAFVPTSVRTTA
jgi:hypothetical protein